MLVVLGHAFFGSAVSSGAKHVISLFTGPWAEEYLFSRQARSRSFPARWFDHLVAARMRATEGRALRRARQILTISRYYERHLPLWHGPSLPPIEVIYGGVDTNRFDLASDRAAIRRGLGLAPEDFLLLAVRRLDPRMGLSGLIDAFAQIAGQFPRARLWLAGQRPHRAALEERIRSAGLGAQVRLLGFVPEEELPRHYAAADCTVLPSLDLEGLGLVTLESLACGTPVLGSRGGATPELLEPLDAGLLFEAGSTAPLAAKLRSVLSNPASLPDRARCRQHVLVNFSWDKPIAAFERAGGVPAAAGAP